MTQLHNWYESLWRIGFAESGESCEGCHQLFIPNFPIMVKRYRELDHGGAPTGRVTPISERWHPTCFDMLYLSRMRADDAPRLGTGGGKIVRGDQRDSFHPS